MLVFELVDGILLCATTLFIIDVFCFFEYVNEGFINALEPIPKLNECFDCYECTNSILLDLRRQPYPKLFY